MIETAKIIIEVTSILRCRELKEISMIGCGNLKSRIEYQFNQNWRMAIGNIINTDFKSNNNKSVTLVIELEVPSDFEMVKYIINHFKKLYKSILKNAYIINFRVEDTINNIYIDTSGVMQYIALLFVSEEDLFLDKFTSVKYFNTEVDIDNIDFGIYKFARIYKYNNILEPIKSYTLLGKKGDNYEY